MLVLSRKSGESIRIGEGIVITITEIRGGRVKIGISAPEDCTIRRGELQDWNEAPVAASAAPASIPTPLAAQLAAANGRRSTTRAINSKQPAATNRVRFNLELPSTDFVIH